MYGEQRMRTELKFQLFLNAVVHFLYGDGVKLL